MRPRGSQCAAAVLLAGVALAGVGCDEPSGPPSASTSPRATSTSPAPSPSPSGTGERPCARPPRYPRPPADRPRYELDLEVRPDREVVTGRLGVDFTPDLPIKEVLFRLWPNGPHHAAAGAHLTVQRVRLDGRRASSRVTDPTTLQIRLDEELPAGTSLNVSMDWSLRLPGPSLDRISLRDDAVTLGSFFPLLPWVPGEGWATDPPTSVLGETSISPTADFDVRVAVPDGASVLASGAEVTPGRWRARAVRDFALAVGTFDVARGIARAPHRVEVAVGVEDDLDEASPEAFRDEVISSLEDLSRRYGPYAWPTLNMAIMPDLGGAGIEYPSMIFQGDDSLERATTHEVAHMWFYSLVGSNPARHPWLDEGVTTYTSSVSDGDVPFFEDFPIPASVQNRLGAPMTFWEEHEDDYFAGIYAQGAQALASVGPERLVDCALASYVGENAYGIAEPRDLIAALNAVLPRAREVLEAFGV